MLQQAELLPLGIILCVGIPQRADFPLLGKCFSAAVGMEQRRHPVAGCVNGRCVRVPRRKPR